MFALQPAFIALAIVVLYFASCIRILREYERGVIFRLGRVLKSTKGPGFVLVLWPIDHLVRVSLRTYVQDVPPQDVITRDNVSVSVNAVIYFRVVDAMSAILEVEDYLYATRQLSQTTLRSIAGQAELDELLAERESVNRRIQQTVDQQAEAWGIKVSLVEIKHVDLPEHMKRVMAKQAESERERRAKVIHAEGEYQASEKLRDAARVLQDHPMAMQMRFLQTLAQVGTENNTTIVFPIPLDLIAPLFKRAEEQDRRGSNELLDRSGDGVGDTPGPH